MENLTKKEIDILVDALEAWESKDLGGEIMMTVLSGLFTKDDPVAKAKEEEIAEKRRKKMELEKGERKETSLLLKAKLIQMKQSLTGDDANKIIRS